MFDRARDLLRQAVLDGAFPAATVDVGDATRVIWRDAFGRLTYEPTARPTEHDTIFDLASLTKVLVTAPIVMQMVERGTLALDDLVGTRLSTWRGADRADTSRLNTPCTVRRTFSKLTMGPRSVKLCPLSDDG
jgi:CubicO group peptidase (beta-lactamase class C family)